MASFDGANFRQRVDGPWSSPEKDVVLDYTAYPIPGGNNTVVITTGQHAQTFEVPFSATGAELSALQGKVGTSGSLVYHAGTVSSCLLVAVAQVTQNAAGSDTFHGVLRLLK